MYSDIEIRNSPSEKSVEQIHRQCGRKQARDRGSEQRISARQAGRDQQCSEYARAAARYRAGGDRAKPLAWVQVRLANSEPDTHSAPLINSLWLACNLSVCGS